MFNLTLLAMGLLVCAPPGKSDNSDTCRQVIIAKAGAGDVRAVACGTGALDVCRKTCLPRCGGCCVATACCDACAKDTPHKVIVNTVGTSDAKAVCGVSAHGSCRPLIISTAGDAGGIVCGTTALASFNSGDGEKVIVRELKQLPDVWIGVRVTPVPEPLAAHLSREGLMIANVVADSPADDAGVERYDVVVSFAGHDINEMDDLLQAIKETGADNTAVMVVIRSGEETSLTIKPAARQGTGSVSFKYEEPEQPDEDRLETYFGHRFKIGPDGFGIVVPHGRLDRLPDDIKDLLEDVPDFDWEAWSDKWRGFKGTPFGLKLDLDSDDLGLFLEDDDDTQLKAEIRIKIDEDGDKTVIERAEDGSITVEREDADGHHSEETYEDIDQLREGDPEAYKLYRRSVGHDGLSAFFVSPKLDKLRDKQKQFQIELRHQLAKTRDQLRDARDEARKVRDRVRMHKHLDTGNEERHDVTARSMSVTIRVDDDGHITLEIKEDGTSRKYEFDSREEFRESEPELYERYMEDTEGEPAGVRRDESLELASAIWTA